MNYSKNSITKLILLSIFFTTLFIFYLFTYKSFSNTDTSSFADQKLEDELEIALEKASMPNKTLIIAIINKAYVESDEYPTMFDLFLEGFWEGEGTRPLLDHLLVVAMDKTAYQRCIFRRLNCYKLAADDGGGDENNIAGEKIYMSDEFIEMMWRRTLFLLNVLKRGYNFIFTDTDVLWLRNPLARLTSKNETILLDLQISTDVFNGNSTSENNKINTGFYLIKSNSKSISLFETWYDLRKSSNGLKEQDVLEILVKRGVLGKLGIKARFLDTLYFSGFCSDSKNIKSVTTVHANCCRSIAAKAADLKAVLRDWKLGFKSKGSNDSSYFQWSTHISCINSWHVK